MAAIAIVVGVIAGGLFLLSMLRGYEATYYWPGDEGNLFRSTKVSCRDGLAVGVTADYPGAHGACSSELDDHEGFVDDTRNFAIGSLSAAAGFLVFGWYVDRRPLESDEPSTAP